MSVLLQATLVYPGGQFRRQSLSLSKMDTAMADVGEKGATPELAYAGSVDVTVNDTKPWYEAP